MLKNFSFMLLSILIRLFTNFFLFVFMARIWGVETFGAFMFPFVVSSLAVIAVDYGFGIQLVRDIGKAPAKLDHLVARGFGAKLCLAALVVVIAAFSLMLWPAPPGFTTLFGVLLVAAILNSFGLFLNLPLRTLDRYQDETRTTFIGNVSLVALVAVVLVSGHGPLATALAFLVARMIYLLAAGQTYRRVIGPLQWRVLTVANVKEALLSGIPFAAHLALGALYFQADTLIIQKFLGQYDQGIYQAGIRLLMGGLILTEVLSNIYLPLMSRFHNQRDHLIAAAKNILRHLLVMGVLGFIILITWADQIVRILYGPKYAQLSEILPYFAVILLIRYAGTCWGLLLTVADKQFVRVIGVSLAFIFNMLLNLALVPKLGVMGAIQSSILTHIILNSIYICFVLQQVKSLGMTWRSWALIAIALYHGALTLYFRDDASSLLLYTILSALSILLVGIVGLTKREILGVYQRLIPVPPGA